MAAHSPNLGTRAVTMLLGLLSLLVAAHAVAAVAYWMAARSP